LQIAIISSCNLILNDHLSILLYSGFNASFTMWFCCFSARDALTLKLLFAHLLNCVATAILPMRWHLFVYKINILTRRWPFVRHYIHAVSRHMIIIFILNNFSFIAYWILSHPNISTKRILFAAHDIIHCDWLLLLCDLARR
jgi:hypothetical protein